MSALPVENDVTGHTAVLSASLIAGEFPQEGWYVDLPRRCPVESLPP
jgi:hypothetical protein